MVISVFWQMLCIIISYSIFTELSTDAGNTANILSTQTTGLLVIFQAHFSYWFFYS